MKLSQILSKLNPKMKLMTTHGAVETVVDLAESVAVGYDPDVALDVIDRNGELATSAVLITSARGGNHPWYAEVVDGDEARARRSLGLKVWSRYSVTVVSGSIRNATRAAKTARSFKNASDFRTTNFPTSTHLSFVIAFADDTYGFNAKRDIAALQSAFSPSSVSVAAIVDDVIAR
jgi:hypothetical protein